MKSFIILVLFIGMFLIMNGIYEQKLKAAQDDKKVEYKFVPRTYFEEQIGDSDVTSKMADMFNHAAPWFDRFVGAGLDVFKTDGDAKKT